jgi:hypothetical protein
MSGAVPPFLHMPLRQATGQPLHLQALSQIARHVA